MSQNPFKNWTKETVDNHNARVASKKAERMDGHLAATVAAGQVRSVEIIGRNSIKSFSISENSDINGLNKTERAFYEHLKREGTVWIGVQNVTLKIADNCRYTPDFVAMKNGKLVVFEVKGFWRDDARVKIKVAARMFPWLKFIAVQKKKGDWIFEEINP